MNKVTTVLGGLAGRVGGGPHGVPSRVHLDSLLPIFFWSSKVSTEVRESEFSIYKYVVELLKKILWKEKETKVWRETADFIGACVPAF